MKWSSLEQRERVFLVVGAVLVLVMLGYWLSSGPWNAYVRAQRQYEAAQRNVRAAEQYAAQIEELRRDQYALSSLLDQRPADFDLWTIVWRKVQANDLVERAEVNNEPTIMTNASGVNLRLRGVSMEELVDLLYDIHTADRLISLHEVELQPASDGEGLQCRLTLVTPRA
jgi:Tfp pilus assembly protein PilO